MYPLLHMKHILHKPAIDLSNVCPGFAVLRDMTYSILFVDTPGYGGWCEKSHWIPIKPMQRLGKQGKEKRHSPVAWRADSLDFAPSPGYQSKQCLVSHPRVQMCPIKAIALFRSGSVRHDNYISCYCGDQ